MQVTGIDCGFKIVLITWEKLACQWRDPWELPICDLLYGQDGIMTKLCQKIIQSIRKSMCCLNFNIFAS